jgi:hypothetical protein
MKRPECILLMDGVIVGSDVMGGFGESRKDFEFIY